MARKFDGRDINQSDSHVSLKDFTRKDFKRELVPPGQLPAAFIVLVAPANVGVWIAADCVTLPVALSHLSLTITFGVATRLDFRDGRISGLRKMPQFRGGGLHIASNCRVCSEKGRLRKQEKRNGKDPEKENAPTGVSKDDPDDASEFLGVDLSALPNAGTDGLKATTDVLAEIVWETTGYRFLFRRLPLRVSLSK
ncbi:hypothetical protein B0H14DRAFT_2607061 [Mycena olivaceomarginata]|nr:hypothetical protein B0H14DRAFT_2607061 [Mycena olivaceomarginata]